jgi:hypothetical protein
MVLSEGVKARPGPERRPVRRTYAAGIEMEDPARWRAFEALMDEAYGRVLELTHLFRLALACAEDEGELRESDFWLFGEIEGVRRHLDEFRCRATTDVERLNIEWLEGPYQVLLSSRAQMCELARR